MMADTLSFTANLPKEQIHLASNMASSVVCVLVSSTNAHLLADAHPDQASTDQGEMRHADTMIRDSPKRTRMSGPCIRERRGSHAG